ncbi:hypothetical protein GLOIN_2v1765630 [Rhizophagus irregularis DAOM 181602=DAOM 197198]|uniref:Protein kinase domain-containing protein n=1 Tax=Rhizophagus irregularis (strain DAOM 181602 / DAOM 197198 / MUCL 43194) TaxID=747089 RepID=A0A2P4QP34_RHIID|nr:hypothetical protein GLOIN_2v1765630 [Rhizophagus irregularis DAOM 181602=DAOM 197198]POG79384.1 hypothetical protein GLOIN_2v1765630 [Rhizophagus irregularis DAOM 181602=DAOM 197198]|eukprot:XP_025186250.1 hypothetical protein GLOIN_2v1765630 [Rhizophagus irregularis DAOM 181602=DAOM 197198]
MSNKIKPEIIDNSNEMINIIDEAITKNYLKYYEYNHFYNIQEIGFRRFGKVYRANYRNSFNANHKTEFKLKNEIILSNQSDNSKKYLLVMEYADDGTTHHLNSNNVLVRQGIIKLSDFGLSKGIEGSFNLQSKLFDMVVYVDPKVFDQIRYNYYQLQTYSLNKRSDIYSIEILQGLREKLFLILEDYLKIYTECWDNEPDNRLTTNDVITKLNTIISNQLSSEHQIIQKF